MSNYREFASFYEMKEWLKQGEYILPAIYRTLNDGKYYFDGAVDVNNNEFKNAIQNDEIKGFTLNASGEMSKVLCRAMDSHFMNNRGEYEDNEGNTHIVNKETFNEIQTNFDFNSFYYFEHYGSVKEKTNQRYYNMILPRQFAGSSIEEIVIPEGIEYIGSNAFENCKSLKKVKLPSTLQRLGRGAFRKCKSLETIYIPGNCKVIEKSAFYSCHSLTAVTFENGVEDIGERAFKYSGLKSVFIPESVHTVRTKAFANCKNLSKVYIGKNVNNKNLDKNYFLSGMAFYMSNVNFFHVDSHNEFVKVGRNGELMMLYNDGWMIIKLPMSYSLSNYEADADAIKMIRNLFEKKNCPQSITYINFNNVKTIPRNCCSNNKDILEIYLPHVHNINYNAFNCNTNIRTIAIGSNRSDDIFYENDYIRIIDKPTLHKKQLLTFNKDCNIMLVGNPNMITKYKGNPLWNQYFPTSYVIVDLGSGWKQATSSDYIPYWSDFTDYQFIYIGKGGMNNTYVSTNITTRGVSNLTLFIASNSEERYDYTVASKIDTKFSSLPSNNSSSTYSHTADVDSDEWVEVSYQNIMSGDSDIIYSNTTREHSMEVAYRKDTSDREGQDSGYLLLRKDYDCDYQIILQGFKYTYQNSKLILTSLLTPSDSNKFSMVKIYFKNQPNFTIHVGSSSELEYDYLTVSHIDNSMHTIVESFCNDAWVSDLHYEDWEFTTADNFYNVDYYEDYENLQSLNKITLENDGGLHFVEIYYVKDGSGADGRDEGYVVIPDFNVK